MSVVVSTVLACGVCSESCSLDVEGSVQERALEYDFVCCILISSASSFKNSSWESPCISGLLAAGWTHETMPIVAPVYL